MFFYFFKVSLDCYKNKEEIIREKKEEVYSTVGLYKNFRIRFKIWISNTENSKIPNIIHVHQISICLILFNCHYQTSILRIELDFI